MILLCHAPDDVVQERRDARGHGHARAVLRDVLAHVVSDALGREYGLAVRVGAEHDSHGRKVAVHVRAVPREVEAPEALAARVLEDRRVPRADPRFLVVIFLIDFSRFLFTFYSGSRRRSGEAPGSPSG